MLVVGFVGAGSMAAAIARGWAASALRPRAMLFADAGSGRAAALAAEVDGEHRASVAELAGEADLLLLAVKPSALEPVAAEIAGPGTAVVSVLGATPLERLRQALPGSAVLRTMPNVAVEVGRGVICHAPLAPEEGAALGPALELLGALGRLIELDERLLDAATAVSGCAPAYLASACEALIEAGAEAGLEPETARQLVSETAAGTGELLLRHDPGEVRRAVASPGGSTEAGLEALEAGGAAAAFRDAVAASLARMEGSR